MQLHAFRQESSGSGSSHLESETSKVYVLFICFYKIPKESAWQKKKEMKSDLFFVFPFQIPDLFTPWDEWHLELKPSNPEE